VSDMDMPIQSLNFILGKYLLIFLNLPFDIFVLAVVRK